MKLTIHLDTMCFYAYHGVLPQEREVGNNFVVDLAFEIETYDSLSSDCLLDTINYAEVYDIVSEEMSQPSQLLEYVVGKICRRLFATYREIIVIEISLAKKKPPFNGDLRSVAVKLSVCRGEV